MNIDKQFYTVEEIIGREIAFSYETGNKTKKSIASCLEGIGCFG